MEKPRIQISKLDAARRQAETAIALYFANGDVVSIHTLAFAAFNITRNLCDQRNEAESFTKWVEDNFDEAHQREAWECFNRAGNFFKHADKDPQSLLEYNPTQIELFIAYTIKQYERLTGEKPIPFQVFHCWFLLHHVDWIKKDLTGVELDKIREFGLPTDKAAFFDDASQVLRMTQTKAAQGSCGA